MFMGLVVLSEESQFCQPMNTFAYVVARRHRRHFIIAPKLYIHAAWAPLRVGCPAWYVRMQVVLSQMRQH